MTLDVRLQQLAALPLPNDLAEIDTLVIAAADKRRRHGGVPNAAISATSAVALLIGLGAADVVSAPASAGPMTLGAPLQLAPSTLLLGGR